MTATTRRRHPIRGALFGLLLGVGMAFVAVGRTIVTLDSLVPIVLVVVGVVIGIVWSTYGPAKQPKGPAPTQPDAAKEPEAAPDPEPEPEPEADADD